MRRYAIATIAYNEAEYIGACIRNWKGLVDKHLVLVSEKPWNGQPVPDDGTADIARGLGAEVIVQHWDTEAHQRNEGLAILYDYDYVLIVDADELYTKDVQKNLLDMLDNPFYPQHSVERQMPAFKISSMTTYWKTHEYVLDPPDKHKPVIAVDPKQLFCHEHRQFGSQTIMPVPGTCHHFSWAKTDAKVKEKMQSFSHADIITPGWYEDVWRAWTPGCGLQVRPYGNEKSAAVYRPAPQEIMDLING